ncbi:hypothetical protein OOK41_31680 [Micromonospora sp. NBC_01655]|uniref:hypothetical protein n=1 Tax=Micromonospora sp. NBC_01655 TaxID=2975983 RepID=UPI002259D0E0|nr:hypothetical protein [Micromonospora sp. NBC_01655]MCX4474823.1 hypothetical protein [Micromonospora sp. NBC_01655]
MASRISPLGLLGGRSPRVDTQPASVDSYGPEAVELMRRAGQPLDAWQEDSIHAMLAVREDGKWACFEFCEWCSRQNGKSAVLEARALAGLLLLGERLIMWSAHEYKTAMEQFRRVVWILGRLGTRLNDNLYDVDGILIKVINTNGEESLERLDTGARIKFVARSKGSGRGFSGDVNLIDETFAYTPVHQAALMPTMSARPNPQVVYASSPPLTGETGEVMFALRRRGDPGAPRGEDDPPWTQDPALGYRDWGLAGDLDHLDKVDLGDQRLWAATNPALGIRISLEHIAREFRAMSPEDFGRERLGIWPRWVGGAEPEWQVIGEAEWSDAQDPASQLDGRPAIGVYVPPDRSYTAIGLAGAAVGGGRHIEVAGDGTVLDYRPGTGWVVARLKELERHQPSVLVIDDKALAEEAEAAGLTVHRANVGDMVAGCQLLYDGICGPDVGGRDVAHIGQGVLTDAARGAVKRDVGGSWAWARRDVAVDTTTLAAVSLALFGHSTPRLHRPVSRIPLAAFA